MTIEYYEKDEKKSIILTPDHEAIKILANDQEFAQVWIENDVNGEACIVSGVSGVKVCGWMQNGKVLTKRTCRVS